MRSLSELQRIFGGEISNGELHCPGPGHSRADRSLSLRPVEDAPNDLGLVYHSFAEDEPTAIEGFIREKLNVPAPKPNGNGQRRRHSDDAIADMVARAAMAQDNDRAPRGKPAHTYYYSDESGALLYQVLRYEPKSFRQRRPDGNGGWIWALGDVRRVLYRLADLRQHPDATVFVCEGEKDADRVATLGHCATTVASGKRTEDCARTLAGRHVLILEDNDQAGRNKALVAARALYGTVQSVRIVRLPGLAEDEDVCNWLDLSRLNTIDKLLEIAFDTPLWTPAAPTAEPAKPSVDPPAPAAKSDDPSSSEIPDSDDDNGDDDDAPRINIKPLSAKTAPMSRWDEEDPPECEWAVPERIPLQQVALLSGDGAVGKSRVQLHLTVAHTLGRDWLGALPMPGPALFIDTEDGEAEIRRRTMAIARHYDATVADMINGGLHTISLVGHDAVLATVAKSGKIQPTPRYQQLLEVAGDIKPKMIGIANSGNVFAGNESTRTEVQQFISLLTRIAIVANGALVLISHPSLTGINTDTGLSGTTQWHNAVRARAYLKGVKPEDGEQPDSDLRELVFKKNNYGPISESIVLRWREGLYLPIPGVTNLDKLAREARAQDVFLTLLRRFTNENRVVCDKTGTSYAPALFAKEKEAGSLGLGSRSLAGAMRELFGAGKIRNEPREGRSNRASFRIVIKD